MMEIEGCSVEFARQFLDYYHPLRAGGSLRGAKIILRGIENGFPVFLAVFTSPRGRWRRRLVVLELSRLAWSPLAKSSCSTFLRKCLRVLKRNGIRGWIITYALPGSSGKVYIRAGFKPDGYSSGARWSRRGPGERPTPDTVGSGRRLLRFAVELR